MGAKGNITKEQTTFKYVVAASFLFLFVWTFTISSLPQLHNHSIHRDLNSNRLLITSFDSHTDIECDLCILYTSFFSLDITTFYIDFRINVYPEFQSQTINMQLPLSVFALCPRAPPASIL